ncbi:hypothetical protein L198_02341 [Cryptococcus wingfieldii CBS 7118]|uniref:Uncharacterized protein n=1 Tax=Cryptococcus wingfieldii CBS 7118 TaxID=1295528 RepID=A0A1E3JRK5_9TREE|nr:hypothetical protein L198_02341 [Cryptococcus wingfieldii CBS 7118]ODO03494.1 hypothetical protein L198_02341 [Cryptococcus wingfieldii CBS 7118]
MSQLSDLELVAQAMSGSEQPPASNGTAQATNGAQAGIELSSLPNVDPSSLLPADLASLHPLLASLSLSPEDLDNLDEGEIGAILGQLEAADGVADDLEGKLDRLLEMLGGVEEEIVEGKAELQEGESLPKTEGEEKGAATETKIEGKKQD